MSGVKMLDINFFPKQIYKKIIISNKLNIPNPSFNKLKLNFLRITAG